MKTNYTNQLITPMRTKVFDGLSTLDEKGKLQNKTVRVLAVLSAAALDSACKELP